MTRISGNALRVSARAGPRIRSRKPVPSTAAFSPSDLSNLGVWYDASEITATADGAALAQWNDRSGNARHALQATGANQPTYRSTAAVVPLANARPVVQFNGTSSFMNVPDFLTSFTAGTAFVVFRVTTDPPATTNNSSAAGAPLGRWGDSTDANHQPFSDGNIYDSFGTTARLNTGNPATALTAFHIYSVMSAASDWRSYINGTLFFSTATNTVGWRTAPTLGRVSNAGQGDYWLDGSIAEVVFYGRLLNATERGQVETYLRDKYATP